MHLWRPIRSLGGAIGFLLTLLFWSGAVYLAVLLPGPVSGRTFWIAFGTLSLLVLGAVMVYWSVAFFTLHYTFDRNGLSLYWGGACQIIPMHRITAIRPWDAQERVWERGLRWPGYHRGRGRSPELGTVHFYATAGRPKQILVCLEGESYVLSPRRPAEFIKEIELRRNLGVTRQLALEKEYRRIWNWSIWRDPAPWVLFGLSLLVNLSLFAIICQLYPGLPPLIPIHHREVGDRLVADIIGRSVDLFKLPVFGLTTLGTNLILGMLLHRHYRLLAILLQSMALVVQLSFWIGFLFILFG